MAGLETVSLNLIYEILSVKPEIFFVLEATSSTLQKRLHNSADNLRYLLASVLSFEPDHCQDFNVLR
jgi:hypothetical protein